jgi:hypothetical protein
VVDRAGSQAGPRPRRSLLHVILFFCTAQCPV